MDEWSDRTHLLHSSMEVDDAHRSALTTAADGMLHLELPASGLEYSMWLDCYLDDADHELLYQARLDGIDDASTDYQYGFGRTDYEGAFVVFNEHNDGYHGLPHPMAERRYTAEEAAVERRLQEAVRRLALLVARAVVAGERVVATPNPAVDTELAIHRVSRLLGIDLGGESTQVQVTGKVDSDVIDRLGWWLEQQSD